LVRHGDLSGRRDLYRRRERPILQLGRCDQRGGSEASTDELHDGRLLSAWTTESTTAKEDGPAGACQPIFECVTPGVSYDSREGVLFRCSSSHEDQNFDLGWVSAGGLPNAGGRFASAHQESSLDQASQAAHPRRTLSRKVDAIATASQLL
jgi:hypothetical protein